MRILYVPGGGAYFRDKQIINNIGDPGIDVFCYVFISFLTIKPFCETVIWVSYNYML